MIPDPSDRLADIRRRLTVSRERMLGFPVAVDLDYAPLADMFGGGLINQLGDPGQPSAYPVAVDDLECEVIDAAREVFGLDAEYWGYVTSGSSEAITYALWLARELYPEAVLYVSAAAHHCVLKAARVLRIPAEIVPTDPYGTMAYDRLTDRAGQHAGRPAIVVATYGTTITEARDDSRAVAAALDAAGVTASYIHVDGALSALPRAYTGHDPVGCADSISVSGHKFLGTPMPSGIILARHAGRNGHRSVGQHVDYLDVLDDTLTNSRSGHAVLALWYAMHAYRPEHHAGRYHRASATADRLVDRLTRLGVRAWRHPGALTVVLPRPPRELVTRWSLASSGGQSHVVCMPGLDPLVLNAFVADLRRSRTGRDFPHEAVSA